MTKRRLSRRRRTIRKRMRGGVKDPVLRLKDIAERNYSVARDGTTVGQFFRQLRDEGKEKPFIDSFTDIQKKTLLSNNKRIKDLNTYN